MTKRENKRATEDDWRVWQAEDAPDPPLLTRTEVLALVERWKVVQPPVDERTLRYWEKQGLVPRPMRSYHAGATRSRYPSWVADLIAIIRLEQRAGRKLAELGPMVRQQAHRLSLLLPRHPFPPQPTVPPSLVERLGLVSDGPRLEPLPTCDPPTLPGFITDGVVDALKLALRQQCRLHGFETTRITVRLADVVGRELVYSFPVPDWLAIKPPPFPWPPDSPHAASGTTSEERPTDTRGELPTPGPAPSPPR